MLDTVVQHYSLIPVVILRCQHGLNLPIASLLNKRERKQASGVRSLCPKVDTIEALGHTHCNCVLQDTCITRQQGRADACLGAAAKVPMDSDVLRPIDKVRRHIASWYGQPHEGNWIKLSPNQLHVKYLSQGVAHRCMPL